MRKHFDTSQQVIISLFNYEVDPMGNEKLAEGIKKFAEDIDKLEQIIEQKLLELV